MQCGGATLATTCGRCRDSKYVHSNCLRKSCPHAHPAATVASLTAFTRASRDEPPGEATTPITSSIHPAVLRAIAMDGFNQSR